MTRATLALLALLSWATPVEAVTYYIGAFNGMNAPSDSGSCGASPNPCATLAHWMQNRRSVLVATDVVRIAPGTYGPVNNANHCLIPTAGVLYEGRNADDTQASAATTVVLNIGSTPNTSPCNAKGIPDQTGSMTNFAIRSMTISNSTNVNSSSWFNVGSVTTGVTFTHFRWTNHAGAMFLGQQNTGSTRNFQNFTCSFCEFDNSGSHGLELDRVNGFTIANSTFRDNGTGDDQDGLHLGAAINGTISDSGFWNNGEDNVDFSRDQGGDDCPASTNNIIFERNFVRDPIINANVSLNSCVFNITIRNNIIFGSGTGINMYWCAGGLSVYNNTVWTSGAAFWTFSMHKNLNVRNNVFISSANPAVNFDAKTTGTGNGGTWDQNVVQNTGAGNAVQIITGCGDACTDVCAGDGDYTLGAETVAQGDGTSYADSAGGLTSWRAATFFGATQADNDTWNSTPSFVNGGSPQSAANLHLVTGDTVAKNTGVTISGFTTDYDNQTRSAPWDRGADEEGAGGSEPPPPTPVLRPRIRVKGDLVALFSQGVTDVFRLR